MKTIAIIYISFFFTVCAVAQSPATSQSGTIKLTEATIHTGNGTVLNNGMIVFEEGKITYVGPTVDEINPSPTVRIINLKGKHVYPGIIAPNTNMGLVDVEAVRSTRDDAEVGIFNAEVRSIIAYNTDSKAINTVRSNGILLTQTCPQGGVVSGNSSVVQLDAWNWEDAVVKVDDGLWLNWPSMYSFSGWWAEPGSVKKNDKYEEQVAEIETFFNDALSYSKQSSTDKINLKFEQMRTVFTGQKTVFVNVHDATEMLSVIAFKEKYNLKLVIAGASDAWKIADELAAKNIAVILNRTHELPSTEDGDIDECFKRAYVLQKAGVLYCISNPGFWQVRNLPFQAGSAAAYGLSKEEALAAITSSTARILGLNEYGTLEEGKSATLIVSEGDLLDMRTSLVSMAFIDGREIDLNNFQTDLYKKYEKKYTDQGLIKP